MIDVINPSLQGYDEARGRARPTVAVACRRPAGSSVGLADGVPLRPGSRLDGDRGYQPPGRGYRNLLQYRRRCFEAMGIALARPIFGDGDGSGALLS
jgi:hypothetical protein